MRSTGNLAKYKKENSYAEASDPGTPKTQSKKSLYTKAFRIGDTRVLDGHFDPKIHPRAFFPCGHLPDLKFDHDDSGLGIKLIKGKKFRFFKERYEQLQEVKEKFDTFRHFKEYQNILVNEIMITIEYCTNCRNHLGTTRHDEQKYEYFATELKRQIIAQYPIIKVVMKPLLFVQNDQQDETLYLRTRIGALEVQLVSKTSQGQLQKKLIFSKLQSKIWPNIPIVVDKIAEFLPREDFIVHLIDLNQDPNQAKIEEEQKGSSGQKKQNKLKGMKVILRPVRVKKQSANPIFPELSQSSQKFFAGGESSRMHTLQSSRPGTAQIRPRSGMSMTSTKSLASLKSSIDVDKQEKVIQKKREIAQETDQFGVVLFKAIPHNVYELEVLETHNYLPEKRVINVFELAENGLQMKEEVELRQQTMGFCRIKLTNKFMPLGDATIFIARKDPDKSHKTAMLREKDPGSGVFEFMIDPAEYVLSINKAGFPERTEAIVAFQGENEFKIDMNEESGYMPQSSGSPKNNFQGGRPGSSNKVRPSSSKGRSNKGGAGSGNVGFAEQNQQYQDQHAEENKQERVRSALVKKCEVTVINSDTAIGVEGCELLADEIGFRGLTDPYGKVMLPINKLYKGQLVLSHQDYHGIAEDYVENDWKNTNERTFMMIPKPDPKFTEVRFVPGSRTTCLNLEVLGAEKNTVKTKEGVQIARIRSDKDSKGIIRIIARITDREAIQHPESIICISDHENVTVLALPNLPSSLRNASDLKLDIGFFSDLGPENKRFFEIMAFTTDEIGQNTYLSEYQTLLKYIHNSKSDIKTLLGFKEKGKIEKNGDIYVTKETIYSSLDKYGLEINECDHLINSALSHNGLYSYNALARKLSNLQPPFKFVEEEYTEDEGEDEYLFGEDAEHEGEEENDDM